jgi:hypothetical protein
MAIQIEIVLIAGVVAVGLIAIARAIIREFAVSGKPPYDAGKPTGKSMSPDTQALPPEG